MRERGYKSLLTRYEGNPIFAPEEFPWCPADQVFNPGQVMTPDGRTILLVAVIPRNEKFARCHVAESTDGLHFTIRKKPIFDSLGLVLGRLLCYCYGKGMAGPVCPAQATFPSIE